MDKNLGRIYILIIIIIYAHTKYKNMLITLGYILYMCHISDNPRQYIYLNTSCKLHYAWKIACDRGSQTQSLCHFQEAQ